MLAEIKNSTVDCCGAFATQDISKSTLIGSFSGALLSYTEISQLPKAVVGHCLQIGASIYLGPSVEVPVDVVNHSCMPNCWVRIQDTSASLVALEDIAAGAELFFDYSTVQTDSSKMACFCGTHKCRKVIGPFKDVVYRAYAHPIPDYVLASIC